MPSGRMATKLRWRQCLHPAVEHWMGQQLGLVVRRLVRRCPILTLPNPKFEIDWVMFFKIVVHVRPFYISLSPFGATIIGALKGCCKSSTPSDVHYQKETCGSKRWSVGDWRMEETSKRWNSTTPYQCQLWQGQVLVLQNESKQISSSYSVLFFFWFIILGAHYLPRG